MKSFYSGLCIIACLAVTACSKDKAETPHTDVAKKLTSVDAGKTASVTQGQSLTLTLVNPGDGGYEFDNPQFSSSVLTLVDHTHQAGNVNMIGDFGTDTWKFIANGKGTTTLEVTASRSWEKGMNVSIFSGQIAVK